MLKLKFKQIIKSGNTRFSNIFQRPKDIAQALKWQRCHVNFDDGHKTSKKSRKAFQENEKLLPCIQIYIYLTNANTFFSLKNGNEGKTFAYKTDSIYFVLLEKYDYISKIRMCDKFDCEFEFKFEFKFEFEFEFEFKFEFKFGF